MTRWWWPLTCVAVASCARGEPAERDTPVAERPTPAEKKKTAVQPVLRDGRAAASCPPLPDPVAIRPAARRWPLRLAATVKGGNKTRSYAIMRTTAAATGARWAGAAFDGGVLWDGARRVRELPCGEFGCTPHDATLADDGKTLLIGLNRVDLASGAVTSLTQLNQALHAAGTTEVTAVAWPRDGAIAIAATHYRPLPIPRDRAPDNPGPSPPDRAIAIDGMTGALVRDLASMRGFSHSVAASSAQLVAMTQDGLTAWDRATFTATRRQEPADGNLLVFDRSGRWLASTRQGEITLWRMPDFCPVARLGGEKEFVHALAFHPTAPVLFASTEHTVHAYSIDTPGEELGAAEVAAGSPAIAQSIDSLVVTADGTRLVVPVYMGEDVLFFDVTPP